MIKFLDDEELANYRKELNMKQIRVARWEQTKFIPEVEYIFDE